MTDDKRQGTASTDGLFRYDGTTTGSAARPLPTDDKRVAEILQDIRGGQQVHINPSGASLLEAYISGLQAALDATTARLREAEGLVKELADDNEAWINDHYSPADILSYPSIKAKYDAEMELSIRARTFLKGANNG